MRTRTKPLASVPMACLAAMLGGCLPLMTSGELHRQADIPPAGAGCSSCHPYELKDMNHFYHVTYVDMYVKRVNGTVICLDCHKTAMSSTPAPLLDSLYMDSTGTVRSVLDHPLWTGLREGVLVRVDTLVQNHPVPSPRVVPGQFEVQEWMTGLAHLNGKVDVVFDSSVSDPARFQGALAAFHPGQETCSAVSCHERPNAYRFAAPSKGLSGLNGAAIERTY